ncbi:MAG: hypothetical protein OER21_00020 [Gemmatimonadota bacterium]|nr:hypothetical protein [Gemmatimonadota bacterium]
MRVAITLLALFVVGLPAAAQQLPPLTPGDTIRVLAPGLHLRRAQSTFTRWTDTTLVVRVGSDTGITTIPFGALRRVEVYRGKNRLKGGLLGGAVGTSLGFLVGGLVGRGAVSGCAEFLCELEALEYAGIGALAGAVVGAAVGVAAAPDRWHRLDLPPSRGFAPDPTPFHQSIGFRLVTGLLSLAIIVATS